MVIGIGCDIVETSRFHDIIKNKKLMNKLFTQAEIRMIAENKVKAAGNFAAKEAIVKITGYGFKKFHPRDIEILRGEFGEPKVNFHNNAKIYFDEKKIKVHISISNTKELAIAYAVGDV